MRRQRNGEHVVERASEVTLTLDGGKTVDATIVGTDKKITFADIAKLPNVAKDDKRAMAHSCRLMRPIRMAPIWRRSKSIRPPALRSRTRSPPCSACNSITADDGANLVTCQVAKQWFGVKRTIARVNDPHNEPLFLRLGVDSIVSAAGV